MIFTPMFYQPFEATWSAWYKDARPASNGTCSTSRSRGPPRRSRECRAPD
eukprot:COSAG06_NODE_67968_length_245_cov_50.739726_1_plen_49_part_01